MNTRVPFVVAVLASAAMCSIAMVQPPPSQDHASGEPDKWRDHFDVDKSKFGPTGSNPYFSLQPGAVSVFKSDDAMLTITVLDETRIVDGVTTRIIEEREEEDGSPIEISRNYFAIDPQTNDVYYFGEEVDIFKDGKISNHEGAWLSGVDGAKFGLMMPGSPKTGDRFYQELAEKVAMDRAEIVSTGESIEAPAGKFEKCVRIKETSPLEKGSSTKVYAAGVGLVRDDEFLLVKHQDPAAPARAKPDGSRQP